MFSYSSMAQWKVPCLGRHCVGILQEYRSFSKIFHAWKRDLMLPIRFSLICSTGCISGYKQKIVVMNRQLLSRSLMVEVNGSIWHNNCKTALNSSKSINNLDLNILPRGSSKPLILMIAIEMDVTEMAWIVVIFNGCPY